MSSARVIESNMPVDRSSPTAAMWPKAAAGGNKLNLKTAPGGNSKKQLPSSKSRRPETATLEKPLILDPKLLRKLDMTRLSREKLMTIENLIVGSKQPRLRKSVQNDWGEDGSLIGEPKVKRLSKGLNTTYRVRSHASRKGLSELFPPPPPPLAAGRQQLRGAQEALTKPGPKASAVTGQKVSGKPFKSVENEILVAPDTVPPPCCACRRSEQPERLHSHPDPSRHRQNRKSKAPDQDSQPKSSVRKPNPIKYRSRSNRSLSDVPRTTTSPAPTKRSPVVRKETFKVQDKKPEALEVPEPGAGGSPSRTWPKNSQIPVSSSRRSNKTASPLLSKAASPVPPVSRRRSPETGDRSPESASPRRPRTVVCYLCMREFGTASLPLHQPYCLERWEREKGELPPYLKRPTPGRPDSSSDNGKALSAEEWNRIAYAPAQAPLVPCNKCGRTFVPSRLPAHSRACIGTKRSHSNSSGPHSSGHPPRQQIPPADGDVTAAAAAAGGHTQKGWDENGGRLVEGRERAGEGGNRRCFYTASEPSGHTFQTDDPANDEETCLIRWRQPRCPVQATDRKRSHNNQDEGTRPNRDSPISRPVTASRRPMAICYICGREFGSASIRIHEPQCLKKWRVENEKLPPERRRREPQKPETVYAPDGRIDFVATDELFWRSHLVQLVPCTKCRRTFNPERVQVHENACKGKEKGGH